MDGVGEQGNLPWYSCSLMKRLVLFAALIFIVFLHARPTVGRRFRMKKSTDRSKGSIRVRHCPFHKIRILHSRSVARIVFHIFAQLYSHDHQHAFLSLHFICIHNSIALTHQSSKFLSKQQRQSQDDNDDKSSSASNSYVCFQQ
jgi:hypothetical protein